MAETSKERVPNGLQAGTVVRFDDQRGFGFIRVDGKPDTVGGDVFVHVRNVLNRKTLRPGQRVTFHLTRTAKGLAAINVRPGTSSSSPYLRYVLVGIGSALVLLVGLATALDRPSSLALWIGLWSIAISIATFGVYGYDKTQAIAGGSRVPEAALQMLGLLGGTPGAIGGILFFRHKTKKRRFLLVLWLTVLVQISLCVLAVIYHWL